MKKILGVLVMLAAVVACQDDNVTNPGPPGQNTVLEDTWVATEPIQCMGNPWEQDWLENHDGDYSSYPKDPQTPGLDPKELKILKDYYARQGVTVLDGTTAPKYEVVCLACTCPEGHTLYLLVSGEDVETMLGFGYRIEDPSDV